MGRIVRTVEGRDVVVFVGGGVLRGALMARVCAERDVRLVVIDGTSDVDRAIESVAEAGDPVRSVLVDTVALADPALVRQVLALDVPVLALRDRTAARHGDGARVVGFDGWLDVDDGPDEIVAALLVGTGTTPPPRAAATGAVGRLTAREREVLGELLTGDPTTAIAERLGISEHTVRTHVHNVLGKLGVGSRAQAAVVALEAGLSSPERAVSA